MKQKSALTLALPIPGTVTPISLTLSGEVSFTRYLETAALLGKIGHGVQWWLGDLLNQGELLYGEKYAQAEAETGFEPGTLANIASVCDRVAAERRRVRLSFAHHVEVAKLQPAEQSKWLEKAEKMGWTRAELRRQLKGDAGGAGRGESSGDGQTFSKTFQKLRAIVDEAREKLDRFPEHEWAREEVKDLIVQLEQALEA